MKYLVTITVSRTEINTKHIFKIACTLLDDDHACYLIDTDRVIPMIGLTSLPLVNDMLSAGGKSG